MVGSSPHTRGARFDGGDGRDGIRIIPAYAGSTPDDVDSLDDVEDHPRIRGEHGGGVAEAVARNGSSPHTRGALGILLAIMVQLGIIPAYAGSTRCSRRAK